MSIDIEITRHLAETFAFAAIALAVLVLMWGIRFLCKILEGEKLDWLTKFMLAGLWLLAGAAMVGVCYLGAGHFGAAVYVVYLIAATVSSWLTFYTLLLNIHPLRQHA